MRIRSIKPEFWRSDDTASLTDWDHRLIFIGLWSYVDDNGVGRDNAALIMSDLFPQEPDPLDTLARVRRALGELSRKGMVVRYVAENRDYLYITGWEHQKIDRPSAPRYPMPLTREDGSLVADSRALDEPSLRARKDQGSGIRDQGSEEQVIARPQRMAAADESFNEFWSHYPKKSGKDAARRAFIKATARAPVASVLAGVIRFKEDPNLPTGDERCFIKDPSKWLNSGCWDDPALPLRFRRPTQAGPTGTPMSTGEQRARATLEISRRMAADEPDHQQIGS